jgi:hypothetical protein
LNVGKQHVEAVHPIEQADGFVAVPSLDHLEVLVPESFRESLAE